MARDHEPRRYRAGRGLEGEAHRALDHARALGRRHQRGPGAARGVGGPERRVRRQGENGQGEQCCGHG